MAQQSAYEVAVESLDYLRGFTGQNVASAPVGDLAVLLAADAIVCALFAVIEAMPQERL